MRKQQQQHQEALPEWWNEFQLSFDESLIMDRHFLSLIESNVCIGSIDESLLPSPGTSTTIESLRLILAKKLPTLNFRELPVSLLRLYFSGQQRLTRFISRLTHTKLNILVTLLTHDGLSLLPLPLNTKKDLYADTVYHQKCLTVEYYLKEVLDLCFSSFETTLSRIIQALSHPGSVVWHQFGLSSALAQDSFWANYPVPDLKDRSRHCIWLACVWRMNASLLLCKLVSPWDDVKSRDWLEYQCKLFRNTHLDLLSIMLKRNLADDVSITQQGVLRDFYPLSDRVCCAEELPDFVCYATDNFKTGSNLKERSSLDDKIGHIYVGKTGPNICKIRNFYDIIIRYGEEDVIIYDILKNVIKCVLLGNLPNSRGSLNLMAQIKINLSFFADEADVEIPEEVFRELTKNKSMKRTRSKKKTKDELVYTKTNFKLWLLLCRHFVLYLLKEFLFYIAESAHWFDELLSVDYKYIRYREIVRIGNGRCRKMLSTQAKHAKPGQSFDWSVIEFEEKSTETYDTKSGEIKKTHAWSLTVARKVQKDDFMKILAKKMTNTEESIGLSSSYRPFYYIRADGEVPTAGRTIALEELHFLCWSIAKMKGSTEWTRWFQVMGMSQSGTETLRMWLFLYNTYDIPDNSLKKLIVEFHANSTNDYMILKTVLKLIEYYKQEQVFHLPLSYAKKQIYALRQLLGIEDWEPTPPLLGFAYQCSGCHKFANAVIEPIDPLQKSRLLAVTPQKKPTPLEIVDGSKKSLWAASGLKSHKKAAKKSILRKPGSTTTLSEKLVDKKTQGITTTSCFLNMAFYNMADGKLYCSKYSSGYKHALMETDANQGHIIMRKKDNSVIVRSNKTVLLQADKPPPPLAKQQRTTTCKTGAGQMSAKEREDKKTQWLLEVRSFDLNETAGEGLIDDVACGLFATTKEPDETDVIAAAALAASDAVNKVILSPASNPITKKNNKKIILGYVNKAITDMKLTCNAPLTAIDMIGIVKNGKVLCVECGSMTEMKNYNITNHGVTCGKHKTIYESDFEMTNIDKRAVAAAVKNKQQQELINTTNVGNGGTRFVSLYQHGNVTNKTLKKQLHPLDVIQKQPGDHCAYCVSTSPKYQITGIGHHRAIVKMPFCKPCYDSCLPLIGKPQIASWQDLFIHLKLRRPL